MPLITLFPPLDLESGTPHTYLILFEYFAGRSLDKFLLEAHLNQAQKQHIFQQILEGVSDAHRFNIIHRDLKPANILVDDETRVKLIDFGMAKFKDRAMTRDGVKMGTYFYMAPEVLISGAQIADARVDIFALGHIFYEITTGQHFWVRRGWRQIEEYIQHYLKQDPMPSEAIDLFDFHDGFLSQCSGCLVSHGQNPARGAFCFS